MTIDIRRLTAADAETYHAIRARSVKEHPEAFHASFEEESARSIEADRQRLLAKEGRDDDLVLAAFEDGAAVGMVGVLRMYPHRRKARHKALIWGVYVAPEARRKGLGRRLMEEAIRAIARADGIELVQLGVWNGNHAARALYAGLGFETYGVEKHAIKLGDRHLDEELMVLFL
jgi:ribosomal protein S18 acetylase RimI-like enzyme